MLFNFIIIGLILLFLFIGLRRGLAGTLLNLAAVMAASILSRLIANALAQGIYDLFFRQSVVDSIQQTIEKNGVDYAVSTSLQAAPDWVRGVLSALCGVFGMDISAVQNTLTVPSSQTLSIAQSIERPVGEISVSIISFVLMFIIFSVIMILFKLLIRKILVVFEIPVVRQLNSVLGAVAGIAEGIVVSVIAVNLFYFISVCFNPSLVVNDSIFGGLAKLLCFFQ